MLRPTAVAAFASLAVIASGVVSEPVFAAPPAPAVTAAGPAIAPGATTAPLAGPAAAPTAIPVIEAPTDPPSPGANPTATAAPRRHRGREKAPLSTGTPPAPTPTPTVPGFATLDGTWEVQVQHPDSTDYSYLDIKQTGATLSGMWKVKKATYAFADGDCTYDGKLVRIVAKTATGTATFSGYVENGTDMVGTLDLGDKADPTPFTAGHRGKDKGLFGAGLAPAGLPLPGSGTGGAGGNFPH